MKRECSPLLDQRARRAGLGEALLIDALRRVVDAERALGCAGVRTDAKDEAAASFYARYGFQRLDDGDAWPSAMFLPMATVFAALDDDEPGGVA